MAFTVGITDLVILVAKYDESRVTVGWPRCIIQGNGPVGVATHQVADHQRRHDTRPDVVVWITALRDDRLVSM